MVHEAQKYADVQVVSPFPRLARATKGAEWSKAARDALLAYCPYGPQSLRTFKNVKDLDEMPDEHVERMLEEFVSGSTTNAHPLPR